MNWFAGLLVGEKRHGHKSFVAKFTQAKLAHRRCSVPIEYTVVQRSNGDTSLKGREYSPLESWIVEAAGSMPAKMPLYLTSECEMSEIGFLHVTV